MWKIILVCFLVSYCNADCSLTQVQDKMNELIAKIQTRTAASTRTVNFAYFAKGALAYMTDIRRCKFSEDHLTRLQTYLSTAESTLATEPLIIRNKDKKWYWVADFSDCKTLSGIGETDKTAAQLVTQSLETKELVLTCPSSFYAANSYSETTTTCVLNKTCFDGSTKAAWEEGFSMERRNRFFTFIKYQYHCDNLDKNYDLQVRAQLEILLAEIAVMRAEDQATFESSYRYPFLMKVAYGGLNGYKDILCDDTIHFILNAKGMCGVESEDIDPLELATLELQCYAVLAMKHKSFFV